VRSRVGIAAGGQRAARRQRGEFRGVDLLDHPEPAELALGSVEVSVVIDVAGEEAVAADPVIRLDRFDDLHGKRKAGDPRTARLPIRQVEPRRGRVMHARLGAHVV
jgi:hypothetical protein